MEKEYKILYLKYCLIPKTHTKSYESQEFHEVFIGPKECVLDGKMIKNRVKRRNQFSLNIYAARVVASCQ